MLALDVCGGKIKAVIGSAKQNTAIIEDYFEVDAGAPSLLSESAPETLGGILRNAMDERGVKEKKCVIPVRGVDVFFRGVSLPKSNPRKLKDMIPHSLGEFPAIKDYYIDYMVEREYSVNNEKMLDILICGIPKKIAISHYLMIKAAGLTPWRMDAQLNCIHKLLDERTRINGEDLKGKSVLFLDAGSSLFSADLVVDAKSVFRRTVPIREESNAFNEFDAISAVLSGGNQNSGSDRLYTKISEETQKIAQFSLSRSLKSPLTRIYIYGEKSSDPDLAAYLTDSLGIASEALTEITRIKLDKSYKGPGICNIFGFAAALL